MDRPCYEFFARTCLSQNEDWALGAGRPQGLFDGQEEVGGLADEAAATLAAVIGENLEPRTADYDLATASYFGESNACPVDARSVLAVVIFENPALANATKTTVTGGGEGVGDHDVAVG